MISGFFLDIYNFLTINHLFMAIMLFLIGLMFGSFFNVVLYRWPLSERNSNILMISEYLDEQKIDKSSHLLEEVKKIETSSINISFPASHCPTCKNGLKWWHNIPVVSFLILKGKCYFCKTPISSQYPIVELLTGVVFLGAFLLNPFKGASFVYAYIFFILTWLILLIDYKTYTIPDTLSYSLLWIGLLAAALSISPQSPIKAILGAVAGYVALFVISRIGRYWKGQDAMGEGDLKLIAGIGAFLGPESIFFVVLLSTFFGIFTWVVFKYIHKDAQTEENNALPYGPGLILAAWAYALYSVQLHALLAP